MTIHLTSLFTSLFRVNTTIASLGRAIQRLGQSPAPTDTDRGPRSMNG